MGIAVKDSLDRCSARQPCV